MEAYLARLKGRVLRRKLERREWIQREKILDKLYDRKYNCEGRESKREWTGTKKELQKLNKMAEAEFFAAKVTGALNGHALSDTPDSDTAEEGSTVLKNKTIEMAVNKRALVQRPNAAVTARWYAAERKRPKSMGL